jgi:hypothetical protein
MSPLAVLRSWTLAPPPSIEPLDDPVQDQANPRIHHQPEINSERLMASRRRQVWHQDQEVQQTARDHGNQLFEKSSKHALVGHPQPRIRCQKKYGSLFAVRLSLFAPRQSTLHLLRLIADG